MAVSAFILRGGIAPALFGAPYGWDGKIDSGGMDVLGDRIAARGHAVHRYDWGQWQQAVDDIKAEEDRRKIAGIGFSGGGTRMTYVATLLPPRPRIDLMILYDPSPSWQMEPIGANVGLGVCYHNTEPLMFGLGGGVLTGTGKIVTIDFAQQHLLVQNNEWLHQQTLAYIDWLDKSP